MLKIPLDPHRSRRPDGRTLDFTVDLDDEGSIYVSIDVDPRSLTSTYRKPDDAVEALLEKWTPDIAVTSDQPEAETIALADEVRRLREILESRVEEIDLHPEPGEARAIAAALIHAAAETDRLFGPRI